MPRFIDSIDEVLTRYSGPWGLKQSQTDYDEPPLWQYDQHVPPPSPESSTLDIVYAVFFYIAAFVVICAALTPTYLAFETQIWRILQPWIDLMEAIHERFADLLPLEINRYDFLEDETARAKTAGLSKATNQQSTGVMRKRLAGIGKVVAQEVLSKITPLTKNIDVEELQQMLTEIKEHSASDYEELMQEFKICQQKLARHSPVRNAMQAVIAERDDIAARFWTLWRQHLDVHRRNIQIGAHLLQISHKAHVKVLDAVSKAAMQAADKHEQELAAKDNHLQQVRVQHQGELVAKDQSARQKDSQHRQAMMKVTTAYDTLKKQHKSDALGHAQQLEEQAADFAEEKANYLRVYEKVAADVDDEHDRNIDKLEAKHAKEKSRLNLRVQKLTDKCKALNLARKTVEEQNVQATTVLQLKEAESGLRLVLGKTKPAMKRFTQVFNERSVVQQEQFDFSKKLWQNYLELTERLDETPGQAMAAGARKYLGLDVRGETTRDIFFPILDMASLLGFFDLPGVRNAGDPPRIMSLAWGAMQPAADAPVETFIEWLVEEDFTPQRWEGLRQLAYKIARVGSPYDIRQILARCHDLRRSDVDQE